MYVEYTKRPHVFSITSGKGGVGKTLTTINLAMSASKNGLRVLVLDGDLGLSNVDIVLGLKARYTIKDVLDGNISIKDIILQGPHGLHIIPSGSGISSLTSLSEVQKQVILEQTKSIQDLYDLVLIDTGAGIADSVMHFNNAADQVVVVTTPEPHAMTDAYAMIKVISEQNSNPSVHLLINQARSADESSKVFARISDVALRFLRLRISHLGHVPHDPDVPMRVLKRKFGSNDVAHTLAGQAWAQLSQKLFSIRSQKISRAADKCDSWSRIVLGSNIDTLSFSI